MNTNYGRHATTNSAETTATGPRAKCDQVVFEALSKACEMIVASRGEQQGNNSSSGNNNGAAPGNSSTVSSRFNLTLPEHASVRQILQKWRRALHLPLRLDVYYQHPSSSSADGEAQPPQRELLERWCLVYALPSSEEWMHYQQQQQQRSGYNKSATSGTNALSQDPIVQLRQVCKKIVIWLRTLYCMARLLPATAFLHAKSPNIGFSLYAVSEGTDDDIQLQQQGFLCQPSAPLKPSYVVGTPYGVLTWKVLTAEASVIQRLTGRHQRMQTWNMPATATVSRAIPIVQQQQQQAARDHINNNNNGDAFGSEEYDDEDYHYYEHAMNHNHSQEIQNKNQYYQNNQHQQHGQTNHHGGVPQSAPAHVSGSVWPAQKQAPQNGQGNANGKGGNLAYNSNVPPNTYHQPSQFRERVSRQPNQQLQRRHTSIEETPGYDQKDSPSRPVPASSGEAKRVMSGLSLAMMTLEEKNNNHNDDTADGNQVQGGTNDKRRAALHQAPPHRRSPQDDSASNASPSHYHHSNTTNMMSPPQPLAHRDSSQEYGYAYNNHIPWQKIHPSTGNPTLQQRGESDLENSPGRTTPSVLGTTPPPMLLNPSSLNSNPASYGKHFLPPRSGNTGPPLTPPFPNRPSGFAAHADPAAAVPSYTLGGGGGASPPDGRLEVPQQHGAHDALPQPLTSLDLLHQSPFSWNPNAHGSMLSSLTMPDSTTLDLRRSLMMTHQPNDFFSGLNGGDWAEEMPFAVEDRMPTPSAPAPGESPAMEDLGSLGASAAVASLAQKCATSQRLQLFESKSGSDMMGDALASQLAEFRVFGATLSPNETTPSSSSVVTNTTPTALRT